MKSVVKLMAFALLLSGLAFSANKKQPASARLDIWDYCDPDSFNVLGPGTCVRDISTGAITFGGFGTELGLDKSVGAWRFATPDNLNQHRSVNLTLVNRGGETHTFTEVEHFGGGFLAPLNAASGNPVPAPECARMVGGMLVPQPPSDENIVVPAGATVPGPEVEKNRRELYQCCIHPWMRIVIDTHEHPEDHHHN
jgi:hypothetical protein